MNALRPAPRDLFDVEIEQAIIGACLVEYAIIPDAIALLSAEEFYDPLHQRLWTAIAEHLNSGKRVTPITIASAMKGDAGLSQLGGRAYLTRLVQAAPVAPNVSEYCRVIRDHSLAREVSRHCEETLIALNAGASGETLLNDTLASLQGLSEGRPEPDEASSWYDAGTRALKAVEAVKQGKAPKLLKLGIPALDDEIGGVGPGELVILAGRPGMGKTALALIIAHAVASPKNQIRFDLEPETKTDGVGVYFASLEMRDEQLLQRGLSMMARQQGERIPYSLIRNAKLIERQHQALVDALVASQNLPIVIDEKPAMTVTQIGARARRAAIKFKREGQKLGLVIVDHLHLIEADYFHARDNETVKLTLITKALKQLAKALKVPVLCLSQLSRETEKRDDKRPILSDLRYSGSIEQDADTVIFAYRQEYYLNQSRPDESDTKRLTEWETKMYRAKDRLELIVSKNRQGKPFDVKLQCDIACNWVGETV